MSPRVVCVACFAVCSLQVIRREIPLMFADSVDVRAMGAWRDLYRNPTSSCLLWSVRRRAAKLGTEDKTLSGTAVWRTKLCLELRYGGQKQWNKQTLGYLIFSTAVQRSQFRDFALCRTHTAVSRSIRFVCMQNGSMFLLRCSYRVKSAWFLETIALKMQSRPLELLAMGLFSATSSTSGRSPEMRRTINWVKARLSIRIGSFRTAKA